MIMEELDKVKSIRKVRMKSGAKYLFVFRFDHIVTMQEYQNSAESIQMFSKRLEKRFGIVCESVLLQYGMTLDIVEKEEATVSKKKIRPVPPSRKPGSILPFGW